MGAQWKHAGRVDSASRKGLIFGKLAKEIMVAARLGDPSPDHNARLRAAVEAARKQSMPRDTIERAIKKGAGLLDGTIHYELVTYEGFSPHRVPVIVECLTDNKNRSAAEIRRLFRKGQLGSMGSVAWMFNRLGVIEAVHDSPSLDIEEAAIEAGAQEVEPLEAGEVESDKTGARFFTNPEDLDLVGKQLAEKGWSASKAELSYIVKDGVSLGATEKAEVESFLGDIDDFDDVHRIYAGLA
jgi:YebC/PmpR family DNA-binding regulatory protein